MPVSCDVGTMFLVKGQHDDLLGQPSFTVERNAFLQAASGDDTEDTLKENDWSYIKFGDKLYIIGEDALKLKNLLTVKSKPEDSKIIVTEVGELRRPMKDGILNTNAEKLSVAIIQKLIANLVGKPKYKNEVLCFCAPGDPVDSNLSVIFHRTMLTNFLKSLGYQVECIPEALAIIFSERPVAEDEDGEAPFSGVGMSFGSGMANVCIRGDTKVPLLDGTEKTMAELAADYADKEFWVYSCRSDGQIVPGKARRPRLTHKKASLVRVYLDNEQYFDCTADHLIMLRDGTYKKAELLNENERLMPLYRLEYTQPNTRNRYEKVKNNRTGKWNATHRLVASQSKKHEIKRTDVVHHKDFNSKNKGSNITKTSEDDLRSKVERLSEKDDVYDLTVDEYSNFALSSGVFVHNCFSWKKMPLINFSIARAGDFVDQESSKVAGIDVSAMTRFKESKLDLTNVDYTDMRLAALDIFYQNMIEHALKNFAEKFNSLDNQIDVPLEIIVAGGTASVPGFIEKFKSVMSGLELPFKVKSIRMAENPLFSVSNGCLIKAISVEKKAKTKATEE